LIIIFTSIISFFLLVFAFLFWHFKFRGHRSDSRPLTSVPSSSLRSRSQDPKFQARMEHYNNTQSSNRSSSTGPQSMVTADEEVEAEFGRVRGNVFEEEGMMASFGTRESNGTRSFLKGWFGLDAGTGAGYNNTLSQSSRTSSTPSMTQAQPSNLARSFSLQSRSVQPPPFLGGASEQERDLERGEEGVELEKHESFDPEEVKGLRSEEEHHHGEDEK